MVIKVEVVSLLLFLLLGPFVYGGEIEAIDWAFSSKRDSLPILKQFADEIEHKIPQSFYPYLPKKVELSVALEKPLIAPQCGEQQSDQLEIIKDKGEEIVTPYYRKNGTIGFQLNPALFSNQMKFGCHHGDFYHWAQGVVLRTLIQKMLDNAHFYKSFHSGRSLFNWDKKGRYRPLYVAKEAFVQLSKWCKIWPYGKKIFQLMLPSQFYSSDLFYKITESNIDERRSPDPLEFLSFRWALSVHLEYFLLDPEYGKREPALYQFLSEKVDHFPAGVEPTVDYHVTLSNHLAFMSSDDIIRDLSPDRIYRIDSVLAHRGKHFSSVEGHSLFRLVVCKPGRVVGPECLQDRDYHVMVSSTAFVPRLKSTPIEGLKGLYKGRVFLFDYHSTVNVYVNEENRHLTFVPMVLDEKMKKLFIKKVLEMHSNHIYQYDFLAYNCTNSSLNLVEGVIPTHSSLRRKYTIRPYRFLNFLGKYGVTSAPFNGDLQNMDDEIFFIPHIAKTIESEWTPEINRVVKDSTVLLSGEWKEGLFPFDYQKYKEIPPDRRAMLLKDLSALVEKDQKVFELLKILEKVEQQIDRQYHQELKNLVTDEYHTIDESWSSQKKEVGKWVLNMHDIATSIFYYPWDGKAVKGYGIPQEGDLVEDRQFPSMKERLTEMRRAQEQILLALEEVEPELTHKWKQEKENLRLLKEMLDIRSPIVK